VCVLYTEIKISTLFEEMMRFIRKLNLALLLGHPVSFSILLRIKHFSYKRRRKNQNKHDIFNFISKIVPFMRWCGKIR